MTVSRACPFASTLAAIAGRAVFLLFAASAAAHAADPAAPTPKEQALMEHACRTVQAGAAHEAYESCLQARLTALRADFGVDLSKLSAGARAKIDAACREAQTLSGREGYLDCLSGQLASLSSASPARAAAPAPGAAAAVSEPAPVAVDSAPPPSTSPWVVIGAFAGVLAVIAVVGGLIFFRMKGRGARQVCRVCGVDVPGSAEMCSACRHDAAEAIRQAALDRAEQKRAAEVEERRLQEEADAQRIEEQRREEIAARRRAEEERLAQEEATRREEAARRAAEERERAEAAASFDADDAVFDPYLALGLTPGASDAEVAAAYEDLKVRYDPEEVAHLGYDAKQHFAQKSLAIERAYQTLTATAKAV